MTDITKTVATPHPTYLKHEPQWRRCRDVVAGQDAVHARRTDYLDKLKDQTDPDYSAYLRRAGFYNATWRTISGLLGMMFRKPPMLQVPTGIEPLLEDITMGGHNFTTLARNIACEVLEVGRVGILVDHPPMLDMAGRPLTVAQVEQYGIRPSIKPYKAETIINWRCRRVNNQHVLSMVVLCEDHLEPDGEWAETVTKRYRVLDLDDADQYRQRVFEVKDGRDVLIDGPIYPLMNGKPMGSIPFYIVGTDGVDTEADEPPLIDLVDLNLRHYCVTADYEHGCHFTGLPMLFLAGVQLGEGEKVYLGSQTAIVSTDPNSKGEFIEFTGQGLGALEANLNRKEQQMAILGARMLAEEKRTAETATTASIHRTGENSVLSAIAIAVSEALERALTVFSAWAGQKGDVEFEISREFMPASMTPQDVLAQIALIQSGGTTLQDLFRLLQRADLIDSTKTYEQHQAEIDAAPMPTPPVPANDGALAA